MKKQIDIKKRMQEIRFITEHCLTQEQFQKQMNDKMHRALELQKATKQEKDSILNFIR